MFATQVSLPKPLGIAFEEVQPGQGVVVDYLVEESNAEKCGQIQPGDVLIAVSAFKVSPLSSRLSACPSTHAPTHAPTHHTLRPTLYTASICYLKGTLSTPLKAPSAMSRHERKLIPCR